MNDEPIWLEGTISVEAALRGNVRQVTAVYVQKGNGRRWERRLAKLQRLTQQNGVLLKLVDEQFITDRVTGSSHGGVVAEAGPRHFVSLDSLVMGVERPFIVMLDGIEDPYNFGQALRSLYAAGAAGVVVRPRNWFSAAGVVARASAGVSEQMPIAIAETAEQAADTFRQLGLRIAATSNQNAVPLYEANLTEPLFLLLGGEKRGITRSFLVQADLVLQIPYARLNFRYSLGIVASSAIIAFEIMRQRRNEQPYVN
ncbi:TrmH family RNA methyltransferase [Candidatus Leptofilum sp.]|uniref:TrmH family RNA methyltransferase n=1 Tax=Candidatus Leptofilum sp. TaxID=3241576 RepID=UPI003B5A1D9E